MLYTVYVLFDYETYLVHYVGQTSRDYLERFCEHLTELNHLEDIRAQGVDLLPYPVAFVETEALAREYELRWIYTCIQTRQPLINYETKYPYLVKKIQACPFDFLNLSPHLKAKRELFRWWYESR